MAAPRHSRHPIGGMAIAIPPRELPAVGLTHQDGHSAAFQAFGIAAAIVDSVGIEGADTA